MEQLETLFSLTEELNTHSDEDADVVNGNESTPTLTQYYVEKERSLSLQRTYILHLCASEGVTERVFLGLSNFTSVVYDLETLSKIASLSGHKDTLTGLKVCSGEDDVVYTSSLDGTIKLWDLRLQKNLVKEFKDNSEGDGNSKPITCFDISSKKNYVAAGTELFEGDAFMLFWDARSTKLLGGYWESHRDDITHVQFHPTKKDWLASGSTDGLLNIFDISEASEDDALLYSMNTESSVDKLQWFKYSKEVDALSCITHTQDLQLWETDSVTPYVRYNRDCITVAMQRTCTSNCYLIDIVPPSGDDEISVLVGSTAGRGECLKMLKVHQKKLFPVAVFNGNKQIVRCSCSVRKSNVLVTGGESGIFTVWKSDFKPDVSHDSLKVKVKAHHSQSRKPY